MSPRIDGEHVVTGDLLERDRVDRIFLAIATELIADEPWHGAPAERPIPRSPRRPPVPSGSCIPSDGGREAHRDRSAVSDVRGRACPRQSLPRERSPPRRSGSATFLADPDHRREAAHRTDESRDPFSRRPGDGRTPVPRDLPRHPAPHPRRPRLERSSRVRRGRNVRRPGGRTARRPRRRRRRPGARRSTSSTAPAGRPCTWPRPSPLLTGASRPSTRIPRGRAHRFGRDRRSPCGFSPGGADIALLFTGTAHRLAAAALTTTPGAGERPPRIADRITHPWDARTPYAKGAPRPGRVDLQLAEGVTEAGSSPGGQHPPRRPARPRTSTPPPGNDSAPGSPTWASSPGRSSTKRPWSWPS